MLEDRTHEPLTICAVLSTDEVTPDKSALPPETASICSAVS